MYKIASFILVYLVFVNTIFGVVSTEYYYDQSGKETVNTVLNKKFEQFSEKVNNGLNNGVYWLKVHTDEVNDVVEIPSSHLLNIKCFVNREKIRKLAHSIFPAYQVGVNSDVLFRIKCDKEAFIPIASYKKDDYKQQDQFSYLKAGLYYGFALMVIIFNLFFFYHFKDRTFLYYSIVLFAITAGLFHRDALFKLMFDSGWFIQDGEIIIHSGIAIFGALFAASYLQHEHYFPKLKYPVAVILIFVLVSYILYEVSGSFFWFMLGELLVILVLTIYWVSSLFLFKKSTFFTFFAIGYSVILFLAFDFYASPLLGAPNLGITTGLLKIGGVLEMLILSYAVVYRMRILRQENEEIQLAIFNYTSQIEKLEEKLNSLESSNDQPSPFMNLNVREKEILMLISKGLTTKEMAEQLFISANTVKYHTKKLYDKLQIKSRQEARLKAVEYQEYM